MKRHRAGLLLGDGTTKMLASGSEEFCRRAVDVHKKKHGHDESEYVIIEAGGSEGLPRKWK